MSDEDEARIRTAAAQSGLKMSHLLRRAIERELKAGGVEEVEDAATAARIRELKLYAYLTRPDVKDRHRRGKPVAPFLLIRQRRPELSMPKCASECGGPAAAT